MAFVPDASQGLPPPDKTDLSPVKNNSSSPLGKVNNITETVRNGLEKMPAHEKRYLLTAIACAAIALNILSILTFIFGIAILPIALPFTATLIGIGALSFYMYRSARDERIYHSPPTLSDHSISRLSPEEWERKKERLHKAMTDYRNDQKNSDLKEAYETARDEFLTLIPENDRKQYEREIENYFLFHKQTQFSDITQLFKNLF